MDQARHHDPVLGQRYAVCRMRRLYPPVPGAHLHDPGPFARKAVPVNRTESAINWLCILAFGAAFWLCVLAGN